MSRYIFARWEDNSVENPRTVYVHPYRLRVSGRNLVDGYDNIVKLKGVTADHNEYDKGYLMIDDVQRMKGMGGNCLEIHALRLKEMMPQKAIIDQIYFANSLDKFIDWCEQLQVYCIIDFGALYWTTWGTGMPDWMIDGHGYGTAPYSEATVNQAYKDFFDIDSHVHDDNRLIFANLWNWVANRYRSKQFVLFSIMNEPLYHITYADGAEASQYGFKYAKWATEVIDAIKASGAKQLIFVNQPNVWGIDRVQPVDRTDIVWEAHAYVNDGDGTTMDDWKLLISQYVERYVNFFQKPFYLGEFSPYPWTIPNWQAILTEQVTYLKTQLIAGFAWHDWGALAGEVYAYYTQAESDFVLQTIYA